MNGRAVDLAIIGGGLAGGLIALALRRARPELRTVLIDSGEALGGNHRWSWFDSDLTTEGHSLMAAFPARHWPDGYEVRFPAYTRRLGARYNSLSSADFDHVLRRELPPDCIRTGCEAVALDRGGVTLADGRRVTATAVLDCRTMRPGAHLAGGWQVFLGRELRTANPHGLTRPVVMDAVVRQHDAYRFMYVLPLDERTLFLEDTYYADSPRLDQASLAERIVRYCERHGFSGEFGHEETGVLPVITGGDFAAWHAAQRIEGVARAGAGAGFVHPLTSYTLPFAVATALAIARERDLAGPALAAILEQRACDHWRHTAFYRMLGKMLFDAAEPGRRYRVFERFYGLSEPLIERFYAARSTPADKLRVLAGKPPVPIAAAMRALLGKGAPLVQERPQ